MSDPSDRGRRPDGRGLRRLATDERGVSTTFGYALSLLVSTLLVAGLLVAAGGFVEDRRENTVRNELRVIGQQVSAEVAEADRLAATAGPGDVVAVTRDLPAEVAGAGYEIAVRSDGTGEYLLLSTDSPAVGVRVDLPAGTPVVETEVSGGDVRVVYDPGADELEVRHE